MGRLYGTAFVSGLVSLALELAASRLLGATFGTTELTWSVVIGLILLYFAIGYTVGGRWADRSPRAETLYTIIVAAAVSIAVLPFLARPALLIGQAGMRLWQIGQVIGPFVVVLVLFSVPVTLLACVSPFIIRLALSDVRAAGGTSGRIYAISTAGSFLGTFLPNLVLVPLLGTHRTFLALALLTLLTGLWGLWSTSRPRFWRLAWLLPLLLALFIYRPAWIKPARGLIYEEESTYNFIQVLELEGRRYLLLNEGQGLHSVYFPGQLLTGGTWDYFLIAPYFNPTPHTQDQVRSLLIIGLAGGTISTQYTAVYGPLPIDGVEIDPAIVRVGQRFFGMTQPNLTPIVDDGRPYLNTTSKLYDVIAVDAYRLPYIPWYLTTVEFFAAARAHLTEQGVVAINVGHTPEDWRLVKALATTMRQVFPSVHVIAVPGTFNAIVIASRQPTQVSDFQANAQLLQHPALRQVAQSALEHLTPITFDGMVLTDDHAPIEALTDLLMAQYVLGGLQIGQ